ncbi:thioesterase family protein [Salinisphaera sp.]|uniref:acyl-CoA thioesterase n=1 Tax=Salinisphaera sp. TaxID=1914330 RepID=UPI002D783CA8|nr:thioesterase family protein [Salinisphaera sp.]HET7313031.1 thioesterase family protein [Salinisphaera sp.]
MTGQPEQPTRDDYAWFCEVPTRWMDNDVYGHVNNVTYYSYFDTAANRFLIEVGGLDIHDDQVAGFVVASNCRYREPIAFPETLDIGLRVDRLGTRSVTYGLAVFKSGTPLASADGEFVHVFVDRANGRSTAIPDKLASALAGLQRA